MTVGFSCPSLRQQAWLICWSRRAPSPSLHQQTMPLMASLERTLICSRVSTPTKWTHFSRHLTFCRKSLISITSWKHVGLVLPLTGDVNALRVILLYHFSNGVFINGGLEGGVTNLLKTLQGNNLQVLSVCAIIFSVCFCPQDERKRLIYWMVRPSRQQQMHRDMKSNNSRLFCLCNHDYSPKTSCLPARF